jgi:hypothetical protein
LRKKNELEELSGENYLLKKSCREMEARIDAVELAMLEYKSLYENEKLKNRGE